MPRNEKWRPPGIDLDVEIVSPEQAETALVTVCTPWDGPAHFSDDERG